MISNSENRSDGFHAGEGIGAILNTRRLNEPLRHVEALSRSVVRSQPGRPDPFGNTGQCLGTIMDHGPNDDDDYSNARYWVRIGRPKWGGYDNEQMEVQLLKDYGGDSEYGKIITATNLAEVDEDGNGTHTMPDGIIVHLFWETMDDAIDPNENADDSQGRSRVNPTRYWFTRGGVGGMIPCKVQKTAGVGGDCTTTCTFVYTVRTIQWNGTNGGATLGTGMTPIKARPAGLTIFAQAGSTNYGIGFYTEDGSFALWEANEVFSGECCDV